MGVVHNWDKFKTGTKDWEEHIVNIQQAIHTLQDYPGWPQDESNKFLKRINQNEENTKLFCPCRDLLSKLLRVHCRPGTMTMIRKCWYLRAITEGFSAEGDRELQKLLLSLNAFGNMETHYWEMYDPVQTPRQ